LYLFGHVPFSCFSPKIHRSTFLSNRLSRRSFQKSVNLSIKFTSTYSEFLYYLLKLQSLFEVRSSILHAEITKLKCGFYKLSRITLYRHQYFTHVTRYLPHSHSKQYNTILGGSTALCEPLPPQLKTPTLLLYCLLQANVHLHLPTIVFSIFQPSHSSSSYPSPFFLPLHSQISS